ncbi:membrane protein, partial [Streptomyces sp. RSD-27]
GAPPPLRGLGGGAAAPAAHPRSAPADDFSDIEAILKKHGI